ncbi:hypothetical protein D3C85_1521770 [compost metagenome]
MAQICAIISQGFAHHADIANDTLVLFAGEFGDLPARHGDRIAWSDDRVHNGPSSVLCFEEAGLQPGFFVPAIQAITFPKARPIPPTELPLSAFNVPTRPDVLPSISFPLMVFLVRAD